MEGKTSKLSDDLYIGGSTPEEALSVWRKVLSALQKNGLKLSAKKTVCFPRKVVILGWLWVNGTIQASPHRISVLAAADLPKTILQLRSYIGSYKFLSKVMKSYSDILSPLEEIVASRQSSDKIIWSA